MATQTTYTADPVLKDLHPTGRKRRSFKPKVKKRRKKRASQATKGQVRTHIFNEDQEKSSIAGATRKPDGIKIDPDAPLVTYSSDWRRTKKLRGGFK